MVQYFSSPEPPVPSPQPRVGIQPSSIPQCGMTDQTGTPVRDMLFYPWGQTWRQLGSNYDTHFAGFQQREFVSGLDPTLFRMYGSRLGRWLTPDPVAGSIFNPQSLNRYPCVLNNPTSLIDPLGLQHGDREDWLERIAEHIDRVLARIGAMETRAASSMSTGCRMDGIPINCVVMQRALNAGIARPVVFAPSLGTWIPVGPGAQPDCPGCYYNPFTDEIWDPNDLRTWLAVSPLFPPGMNGAMQWLKQMTRGVPQAGGGPSLIEQVGTPMKNVGPTELADKEWEAVLRGTARYLNVLQQYLNMISRGSMTISVPLVIVDPRSMVPYAYGGKLVDPRM